MNPVKRTGTFCVYFYFHPLFLAPKLELADWEKGDYTAAQ
jgi:hypothetical protein